MLRYTKSVYKILKRGNENTINELLDSELQELEEDVDGYLSNDSDDSDFIFDGDKN